jgi:dTDP-4-dehydrorhamnose reductase
LAAGCCPVGLDITDRLKARDAVRRSAPEIIIHAAALSAPDFCEDNRELTSAVNIEGTLNMLDAAGECGCRLVYVSTDLVFDGERGNYTEQDPPAPVNYYGWSKREGEKLCLQHAADALVVRITLQYGWGNSAHSSFSDWLMNNLRAGRKASLFTDQYRTMTCVMDTARGLELAALHGSPREIYHLTGPERISRYGFGCAFADCFNLPRSLLQKALMADVSARAERPRDVSLNGEKFLRNFNYQPRGISAGIAAMAEEKGVRGAEGPRGQVE